MLLKSSPKWQIQILKAYDNISMSIVDIKTKLLDLAKLPLGTLCMLLSLMTSKTAGCKNKNK